MVWHDFALRVLVALALGAFIGAKRPFRQRLASLRMNASTAPLLFATIFALSFDQYRWTMAVSALE
jgi:putative Mg2+ transporter-C (MgtC) family protein